MNPSIPTAMILGAHPDDGEIRCGGMAALWRRAGWAVHYVSMTDGGAGHQTLRGEALVGRRAEESRRSASLIGATPHCLGLPDGMLEPSVVNRMALLRLIRQLRPDVIVTHRPNDYHPDHRYTSQILLDASFLLAVPAVAPDAEPMRKPPTIFYCWDDFKDPAPFRADIVVDIDPVLHEKLEQMMAHESQFFEWLPWVSGVKKPVPMDRAARKDMVARWLLNRHKPPVAEAYRAGLERRYGKAHARTVVYAEAFQRCEYGNAVGTDKVDSHFPAFNAGAQAPKDSNHE